MNASQVNVSPKQTIFPCSRGSSPKSITRLMSALKNCTRSRDLRRGRDVHLQLDAAGLSSHVYMVTSLINMYAKCGEMSEAQTVFDRFTGADVIAWTALITGYVQNGENRVAIELFDRMKAGNSCTPDATTYVVAISACTCLVQETPESREKWLAKGKTIYSEAQTNRCCDIYVESKAVDMFAKCRCMEEARTVFDSMARPNVVAWSALVQGYVDNGLYETALEVFSSMQGSRGCPPNDRTYVAALSACGALAARKRDLQLGDYSRCLERGKRIHAQAVENNCWNVFVENTAVDMYCKAGCMLLARQVFDRMSKRSVVSWNALILGYMESGENHTALELFACMNVKRDSTTYLAAFMACGSLMALEKGRFLHEEASLHGFTKEVPVVNSLVDFYGKCGDMETAKQMFDSLTRKTVVSWTALMFGYGLQGDTDRVFELFQMMKEQDVPPNEVTCLCILTACSHAGLTERGRELFESMSSEYGIRPNVKHFACMVDLLGRANFLEEALKVVRNMPCEPNGVVWFALLGACKQWNNVEIGQVAYEALVRLDVARECSASHVLMSSIYRRLGMEKECDSVLARRNGLFKREQTQWTNELGLVHTFELGCKTKLTCMGT